MAEHINSGSTKKKKLCILGTASSMPQAPFDDDSFDFWGTSPLAVNEKCKRVDRLFEFHPERYWRQPQVLERLEDEKRPIYMLDKYEEIPNSVAYPYQEIKKQFHHPAMGDNLFVTNSIVWEILLALHEGYKDISFFGVHMAHETEWGYQQPSCSWALGILHGWSMMDPEYQFYIAEESQLLKARYEYGFDEPSKLMRTINTRLEGLRKGVDKCNKEIENLAVKKAHTEGAVIEAEHWYKYIMGHK